MEVEPLINDAVLQTIVSDHSPCTAGLKLLPSDSGSGDFFAAWGGISSVGLGLPILWTESQNRKNGVAIEDIVRWCSWATAKQVGLETSKGDLGVGYDGDVIVFDDEAEFKVCSCAF
jgi:allantoinase